MFQVTIDTNQLTNIEQKIFAVLKDGEPHYAPELLKAIDELATKDQLSFHISNLRARLLKLNDVTILHKAEGKRIGYLLARHARVTMDLE